MFHSGAAAALIAALLLVDLLAAAAVVSMLVSLGKRGDERRKLIVQRSCAGTLLFALGYLALAAGFRILCALVLKEPLQGISPLGTLAVISMVYLIQVFRYKRKYGDIRGKRDPDKT